MLTNKIKYLLFAFPFVFSSLLAENIVYTKNQVHAFLPKNKTINLFIGTEMINDTLDLFKVKESEINSNTSGFDTLGDMWGANIELSYSFWNRFLVYTSYSRRNIDYLNRTLKNDNINTYIRYQVFNNKDFAFAIDGGIEINKAKDTTISGQNDINPLLKRISPNSRFEINGNTLFYGNSTLNFSGTPYLKLSNTEDTSFYGRAILSYKKDDLLVDFFTGYKQIDVKTFLDSSFAHDSTIKNELASSNIPSTISSNRDDGMIFAGVSLRYKFFKKLYTEFSYKYNKMLRIDALKENDNNHVFDVTLNYPIKDNIAVYIGGKIMTSQLNGEMPYIYNQYTKTTFDHKYGYANTGLIFKF